jgi:hypothetical protein
VSYDRSTLEVGGWLLMAMCRNEYYGKRGRDEKEKIK